MSKLKWVLLLFFMFVPTSLLYFTRLLYSTKYSFLLNIGLALIVVPLYLSIVCQHFDQHCRVVVTRVILRGVALVALVHGIDMLAMYYDVWYWSFMLAGYPNEITVIVGAAIISFVLFSLYIRYLSIKKNLDEKNSHKSQDVR